MKLHTVVNFIDSRYSLPYDVGDIVIVGMAGDGLIRPTNIVLDAVTALGVHGVAYTDNLHTSIFYPWSHIAYIKKAISSEKKD